MNSSYHSRNASLLSKSLPDGGHGPKSQHPFGMCWLVLFVDMLIANILSGKKVWDQISDTRVFVAQNNGQTCFGKEKARINCKMRFTKASQKIDCNFTLWFKLILIEHRNGLSKQKCGSIVNKKAYQKHKQLNDPNFTIAFEAFIFYFAFSMQW